MKQMKITHICAYTAVFIGLTVMVFMWRCAWTAFLWAGWGGFGGVSMKYTAQGERNGLLILGTPVLLLLFLLLIRLGRNIIKKVTISRYGKDLFFFIAAISVGNFLFYMPEIRQMIVDAFSRGIVQAGWMQY